MARTDDARSASGPSAASWASIALPWASIAAASDGPPASTVAFAGQAGPQRAAEDAGAQRPPHDRGPAGIRATLCALATPPGRGALGLIRLTGPASHAVASRVAIPLRARPLGPGAPRRVGFVDEGGRFDDGLAWLAAAPATVTGEDVAELSFHGNPLIASRLLDALVSAGARLALPGEFTRRAFEAGRVDLLAAEAVQQLVDATTHEGLAIARGAADGALQAEVAALRQAVVDVTAELEARLDYPEEAVSWAADAALIDRLSGAATAARALAASWSAGRAWVEGARVALVGAVNAGKSSLFNALLGRPRALVHATPGTTRDVLEVTTTLDGLAVTLLDTAGERATDDPIEAAGQALAAELVGAADLVIVVLRAGPTPDPVEAELVARTGDRPRVVVYNGVDRQDAAPAPPGALATSARTGEGVDALRAAVRRALVGGSVRGGGRMIASARQRDRLLALADGLDEGARALAEAGEAAAADALVRALGEIDALVGRDTREDVLDALFARFCVGK